MKYLITALVLAYSPVMASEGGSNQSQCIKYSEFIKMSFDEGASRKFRYASSVSRRFIEIWQDDKKNVLVLSVLDGFACFIDKGYAAELPA